MNIKECRTALVDIYVAKEENDAETKNHVLEVVEELPVDMDAKKIKALKDLCAKEAKGKFLELSAATGIMADLIEELEDE